MPLPHHFLCYFHSTIPLFSHPFSLYSPYPSTSPFHFPSYFPPQKISNPPIGGGCYFHAHAPLLHYFLHYFFPHSVSSSFILFLHLFSFISYFLPYFHTPSPLLSYSFSPCSLYPPTSPLYSPSYFSIGGTAIFLLLL